MTWIQFPDDWEEYLLAMGNAVGDHPPAIRQGVHSWIKRLENSSGLPPTARELRRQGPGVFMIQMDMLEFPTKAAEFIFEHLMPKWSELFLQKNAHYGNTADLLGAKGQFAAINKKFWPMKALLWDGKEPTPGAESLEEIINDQIGHLFLTLYYLQLEKDNG